MIPYIHPEFVEALKSLATTNRPAQDTSPAVSPKPLVSKGGSHLTPLRRVTARLRSLIGVVANNK
jgi:hypothetical protein